MCWFDSIVSRGYYGSECVSTEHTHTPHACGTWHSRKRDHCSCVCVTTSERPIPVPHATRFRVGFVVSIRQRTLHSIHFIWLYVLQCAYCVGRRYIAHSNADIILGLRCAGAANRHHIGRRTMFFWYINFHSKFVRIWVSLFAVEFAANEINALATKNRDAMAECVLDRESTSRRMVH